MNLMLKYKEIVETLVKLYDNPSAGPVYLI